MSLLSLELQQFGCYLVSNGVLPAVVQVRQMWARSVIPPHESQPSNVIIL